MTSDDLVNHVDLGKERKKEIPYKEGDVEDRGSQVGYTYRDQTPQRLHTPTTTRLKWRIAHPIRRIRSTR